MTAQTPAQSGHHSPCPWLSSARAFLRYTKLFLCDREIKTERRQLAFPKLFFFHFVGRRMPLLISSFLVPSSYILSTSNAKCLSRFSRVSWRPICPAGCECIRHVGICTELQCISNFFFHNTAYFATSEIRRKLQLSKHNRVHVKGFYPHVECVRVGSVRMTHGLPWTTT